jgi:hypothetical protein
MPADHPEIPDQFGPASRWVFTFVVLAALVVGASDSFRAGNVVAGCIYVASALVTFFVCVKWKRIMELAKSSAKVVAISLLCLGGMVAAFAAGRAFGHREFATPAAIGSIVWNFEQTANGAGFFLSM